MQSDVGGKRNKRQVPTNAEIYAWTLRSEAIAVCLAEDVLQMRESGVKDLDFHWLGRVPCRSVKLVGTIVGIKGYETRRVYTIDDGSAVINCAHKPLPPLSPSKKRPPQANLVTLPPELPPPVSSIGRPVMVIGAARKSRDSKQILVDQITPCPSINDQAYHWKLALDLRQSYYFIDTPFTIPQPVETIPEMKRMPTPGDGSQETPANVVHDDPPSEVVVVPPLVSTSTLTSLPESPPRLRHPSRLRTRELTANTFRIYVKHYMDNHKTRKDPSCLGFDLSDVLNTPTKRAGTPDILRLSNNGEARGGSPRGERNVESGVYGYTLSYLRRVPELRDLAKEVIEAEEKTKKREERKAKKEAEGQAVRTRSAQVRLSRHEKAKRLFRQAVLKLCDDGSIVIWDGPKRAWEADWSGDASRLWKKEATMDVTASSWVGSIGVSCDQSTVEDDELSEPLPEEESYISLTPAYLGTYVEGAIREIMARTVASQYDPKGPTKDKILASLRGDGRWRRVGDWAVVEALEYLKQEERIWDVGDGHWELTV